MISTLCAACVLNATALHALGDHIALRHSVRLSGNAQVVTLGEIAIIEGEAAQQWRDLPIAQIQPEQAVQEIPLRQVRAKLDEAGVNWARVNLSGRNVIVRSSRNAAAEPPLAMAAVSVDELHERPLQQPAARHDEYPAAQVINTPTLRGVIASTILSNLKIEPDALRLQFMRSDAELLDQRNDALRYELHPHGSFDSDRIELTIRFWNGSRVEASRSVTVLPLIRVNAASPWRDLDRGQMISEADVTEVEQWLPPMQARQIATRVQAIGRTAGVALKAGELIRAQHVQQQTIVKRGDTVIVRCLVGGSVISLQAEARSDGGEGDRIECRKPGERQTFIATITAPGEAIIDLRSASPSL